MDNLPIPQSRIEELMNAFISRDSSRISTPQSRIEEFWYHLIEGTNALPIPQSRIELLLKKIIENDTKQIPLAKSRAEEFLVSILTGDINKLPIPQSRSEYYLDYITRNNLVLDDIEYVKYSDTNITASNTVQKPFRSAILSGNTLVNLFPIDEVRKALPADWKESSKGVFEYTSSSTPRDSVTGDITLTQPLIAGRTYILKHDSDNTKNCASIGFVLPNETNGDWYQGACVNSGTLYSTQKSVIYTPNKDIKTVRMGRWGGNYVQNTTVNIKYPMILEYQEGMENWDIPYFEGMQSVKLPVLTTTGKNLFDKEDKIILNNYIGNDGVITSQVDTFYQETYIPCKINTDYTFRNISTGARRVALYDINKKYISRYVVATNTSSFTFNTGNANFMRISCDIANINEIQLEEGSIATSYEPYQSNILTVNEDVTLRSNGDVCDELDLLTGKLTQRIDEDGEVLVQEVVKTVGLKVVDQDGNPVKQLSAFDETTHIVSSSASDNSLIAIAEVEVPTKLIEALNDVKSLSSDVEILINEVDNAQKLQDENSTMVMSTMTELYEMVLMIGGGS